MEPIARRRMLKDTCRMSAALIGGAPLNGSDIHNQADHPKGQARKLKVIFTGGHPGDPEYGCGGTITRYASMGHDITLLYLNNGEWPAAMGGAPAATRMAEAKKACEILGARPAYAGQLNGKAVVDQAHYEEYLKIFQAARPDLVFSHWPIDNHPDHRACWDLTYNAWLKLGRRFALYYYEVSDGEDTLQFQPTHYVDITGVESRKRDSCYAHASQTPDKYYSLQDTVHKFRGIESGFKKAEAYVLQTRSPVVALPSSEQNRN